MSGPTIVMRCALGQGALHGVAVDANTAYKLLASGRCTERKAG
jgi:hypothetical protein